MRDVFLALLADRPRHGYELGQLLRQRLGDLLPPLNAGPWLRPTIRMPSGSSSCCTPSADSPAAIVASRDEADPSHPRAVGEAYADAIPGATVHTEAPGASPLAWQGSQLSRIIAGVAARAG